MKKEIDIFDLLPTEACTAVNKLGFDFLQSQGYKVAGVNKSYKCRARLTKAMKKRGEELRYNSAIDKEQKAILVWFELYKGTEVVAKSSGIKFLPNEREREDEEG